MAGGKSDALENEVLNHILGGGDLTRPATVWVALYTATPSDAGGGTEATGNSYARVAVTNNATNFPAASGGAKSNGTAITFPQASGSWGGDVVAWGIHRHATNDDLLYWGPVSPTKSVGALDTPSFAVGDLDITED